LEQNIVQDGQKPSRFWMNFFLNPSPYEGVLVSAKCFFGKTLEAEDWGEQDIAEWVRQCDVRETHTFASHFPYRSPHALTDENCYTTRNQPAQQA